MIWKELEARYPQTNKQQYLLRLKQIQGKATKLGTLEKTEKGRYKFTTGEKLKPDSKPAKKEKDQKITHPKAKPEPEPKVEAPQKVSNKKPVSLQKKKFYQKKYGKMRNKSGGSSAKRPASKPSKSKAINPKSKAIKKAKQ